MDPAPKPVLAAALDQLWTRFLPQIRERVSILESAARSLAAHKLAGVLGTFNLSHGTGLARQLEVFYSAEGAPDPIFAAQAAALASELHTIVETRG